MSFEDVTAKWNVDDGGERHVRTIDDNCWISVLHRLTGFGYMEWETAICFRDPETKKHIPGSPIMVRGDWRTELCDMPKDELMAWIAKTQPHHQISFDMVMNGIRSMTEY